MKTDQSKRNYLIINSEIIEGLFGLLVITVINVLAFKNQLGFLDVDPHPYWIVVLAIAVRYGFSAGFWTGIMAAITFLMMAKINGTPLPVFDQAAEIDVMILPVLFVIVGIILGDIRETQKNEFEKIEKEYAEIIISFENLSVRYKALNTAKQEIDSRIISQEHTISTLYKAAHGLKSLDEKDIYPAMIKLLTEFISVEACSVYLLSKNQLKLEDSYEKNETIKRSEVVSPDEGMMGTVVSTKDLVSLNQFISSEDFVKMGSSGIIMSAPLLNKSHQILGILNIEHLPFAKFNPQTVRMVSLIADWAGVAMENARKFKDTKEQIISDDITGAYTNQYLQERLKEECQRARRYKIPLSLICLRINDFEKFSEQMQKDILMVLSIVFKNKLREVDLVFHDTTPSQYIIVLPNSSISSAKEVKEKVNHELSAFMFKPYAGNKKLLEVAIGTTEFNKFISKPEEIIQNAIKDMHV